MRHEEYNPITAEEISPPVERTFKLVLRECDMRRILALTEADLSISPDFLYRAVGKALGE